MLPIADSLSRLGTESAFAVLARARELERTGRDIIHLEIGEPDFETPEHVAEAGIEAIRQGDTHYCPSAGIPELREAAAEYIGRSRNISVSPANVVVANGAKPFLFFTILACANPGDEVIYPDPGFPIYESAISWSGAVPVPLPLREELDFSFDPDDLARLITPRTRLVILNSPQNPTGAVILAEAMAAAAELIAGTDAWVLADEVYWQLLYEGTFASIASLPGMLERTVLLDGCSKTFSMTGWRCGFAAVPERLVDPLVRFFVNCTSCVPPFVQRAAVAALTGPMDAVDAMVAEFSIRRNVVVDGLRTLPGVSCCMPAGAFYVFPNVSGTGIPADELADRLLDEAGVAVLAGSAFGKVGTDNLRLSYANSQANLREALSRIGTFLSGLQEHPATAVEGVSRPRAGQPAR